MKTILTAALFVATSTVVADETFYFPAELECGSTSNLVDNLRDNYDELPFAIGNTLIVSSENGKTYRAKLEMFLSQDRTYSLVAHFDEDVSCLVNSGNSFTAAINDQTQL